MYSFRIEAIAPAPCGRRAPHQLCVLPFSTVCSVRCPEALVCGSDVSLRAPSGGRQRQFHQIGVEWLGAERARSDVEVIALAWDLPGCRWLAATNSLGTAEDRQAYRKALVAWLEQRSEALDPDSQTRLSTNPLRILDSQQSHPGTPGKCANLADALSDASRERFAEVQRGLSAWRFPTSSIRGWCVVGLLQPHGL